MEHIFTWIPAYEAIVSRLRTMRNNQFDMINILTQIGVEIRKDEDPINNKIPWTEIDPFTFLCHLNIYGDVRRKKILRELCELWKIDVSVEDVCGVPTVMGQKIWLFPYKYGRTNNEITKLWDFFEAILDNKITDAQFNEVLAIKSVGPIKLTEVMFMIKPYEYLCLNGAVAPFLNKVKTVDTNFSSYSDLIKVFGNIKSTCKESFPQLSYEGYLYKEFLTKPVNYYRIGSTIGNGGESMLPDMLRHNVISIGWSDIGDIDYLEQNTRPGINKRMQELGYNTNDLTGVQRKNTVSRKAGEIFRFYHDIKPHDIVIVNEGTKVLAIAKVFTHNYIFLPELKFPHARVVEWLHTDVKDLTIDEGNYTSVWHLQNDFSITAIKEYLNETKTKNTEIKKSTNNSNPHNMELNTILYGPPGTGKTYNAIPKAVAIVNPEYYEQHRNDWDKLKEEFDRLLITDLNSETIEGQITFATFHQSMSYEDFVEGIKPELVEDEEEKARVIYDIKPGIFKVISELAYDNILDSKQETTKHLSFDDALKKLKEELEDQPEMKIPMKTEGKEYTIKGFTKSSIRFRKASGGESHTMSIATLRTFYYGTNTRKLQGIGIYYPGLVEKLKSYNLGVEISKEIKKYVLIIDEINRGNVSQIFGELITLLEKEKRFNEKETISATLPYSGETFVVPNNLYIIGTMNTADRSVEALDAALRRRFSFEFMPPMPELLIDDKKQEIQLANVSLKYLLTIINKRITYLLDEDHQIGHSYFMKLKDEFELKAAFKNKIIPLLKEYFYNDYGKIRMVLGDGFVKKNEGKDSVPKFAEVDEFVSEKITYEIISIDDAFDLNLALQKTVKNV